MTHSLFNWLNIAKSHQFSCIKSKNPRKNKENREFICIVPIKIPFITMFFHVWIELESNEMGLFTSWVYCSVHWFVCLPLLFHSKHIVALKMCRSHVHSSNMMNRQKCTYFFHLFTHTQCHHLFHTKNLELQFLFIHKMDISLENDLPTSYVSRNALGYVERSNLLTTANWLKITAHLDVFFDGGHTKKVPLSFPNEKRFFY